MHALPPFTSFYITCKVKAKDDSVITNGKKNTFIVKTICLKFYLLPGGPYWIGALKIFFTRGGAIIRYHKSVLKKGVYIQFFFNLLKEVFHFKILLFILPVFLN